MVLFIIPLSFLVIMALLIIPSKTVMSISWEKAKNRLPEIISAYERLCSFGLKCDFHLVGVEEKNQVHKDNICYISGMDYQTNLQHILHTKCLLEVMQQNGTGYTQRMCEAVALDKKKLLRITVKLMRHHFIMINLY